ncbi:MAG: shikimate kinase [Firmicutes bacterium]|nr:shikimate kinase [[Eubacterium] siraeum]MCM1488586.1 shikimate kinase [Bacillota bacterium]
MKNIILIGMPGSGKSTVGVVLAKTLGTGFIDTDLIIQVQRRNTLQRLIDTEGLERFKAYEEDALLSVTEECGMVVATGGSAVFCEKGMRWLKRNGICIYLDLPVYDLQMRLANIKTRGIACRRGEGLEEIMAEREPLYNKFADVKIDCTDKTAEQIVERIVKVTQV